MASELWAMFEDHVIEYGTTEEDIQLFFLEAESLLRGLNETYATLCFRENDQSVNKAIWMLHTDALNTLQDCVLLLRYSRPLIVRKMYRDIYECLDRATLIREKGDDDQSALDEWYGNKFVKHRRFRDHLNSKFGRNEKSPSIASSSRKDQYELLSKWSHHCYDSLCELYSLDDSSQLVYHGGSEAKSISHSARTLAQLIRFFLTEAERSQLILKSKLDDCIAGLGWDK